MGKGKPLSRCQHVIEEEVITLGASVMDTKDRIKLTAIE